MIARRPATSPNATAATSRPWPTSPATSTPSRRRRRDVPPAPVDAGSPRPWASRASSPTPRRRSAAPDSASSVCTPPRSPPSTAGPPHRAARSRRRSPPRRGPPAPRSATTCWSRSATSRRGKLWAIDEPAANLPARACFDRGPATTVSGRAFLVDAAENFFHGNRKGAKAASTCGWETPVILSLGTFPWVFGSKLHRTAPGLDWDAAPPWNPAALAMRLATSLWQPLGNLQQDATQVVQSYPPLHPRRRARPRAAPDLAQRSARRAGPQGPAPGTSTTAASTRPAPTRRSATSRRPPTTSSCAASPPSSRCAAPTRASPASCRSSCAERSPTTPIPACAASPTTPSYAASPRPERDPWPCRAPATRCSPRSRRVLLAVPLERQPAVRQVPGAHARHLEAQRGAGDDAAGEGI
jgi:hypothetical protein